MSFDLTCAGCGALIPCPDIPDSQLYSLQQPPFPFVLDCPPGSNCQQQNQISFVCCNQLIGAGIPAGASPGQIQQIINQLVTQCASLQSTCGEFVGGGPGPGGPGGGPTPTNPQHFFLNQPQTCTVLCPDGTPFSFTLPAGYTVAASLLKANNAAQSLACQKAKANRFCLSTLPANVPCGAFSATVSASGPVVTPCTWTVVSGALPTGLTLGGNSPNSDTTITPFETIQGTPTTNGIFTFVLQCTGSNGAFIQKAYSMTVTACATCPATLTIQNFDALFNNPCAAFLAQNPTGTVWHGTFSRIGADCSPNPTYSSNLPHLENFPGNLNCVCGQSQIGNFLPFWTITIIGADPILNPIIVWQGAQIASGPTGTYAVSFQCTGLNIPSITLA